jgi:anthranilate phosphoribosyltransferase
MSMSIEAMLEHLIAHKELTNGMVKDLFLGLLKKDIPKAQIAALLALVRTKGLN